MSMPIPIDIDVRGALASQKLLTALHRTVAPHMQ